MCLGYDVPEPQPTGITLPERTLRAIRTALFGVMNVTEYGYANDLQFVPTKDGAIDQSGQICAHAMAYLVDKLQAKGYKINYESPKWFKGTRAQNQGILDTIVSNIVSLGPKPDINLTIVWRGLHVDVVDDGKLAREVYDQERGDHELALCLAAGGM